MERQMMGLQRPGSYVAVEFSGFTLGVDPGISDPDRQPQSES